MIKNWSERRSFTIVCGGVATLLLTAAALKAIGIAVSLIPSVGIFSSMRIQLAVICWETILGSCLLLAILRRGEVEYKLVQWVAACATFSTFVIVSISSALVGVLSAVVLALSMSAHGGQ